MPEVRSICFILFILLCVPAVSGAGEKEITLKSGKVIKGEVLEETDTYLRLKEGDKLWRIPKRMISDGTEERRPARRAPIRRVRSRRLLTSPSVSTGRRTLQSTAEPGDTKSPDAAEFWGSGQPQTRTLSMPGEMPETVPNRSRDSGSRGPAAGGGGTAARAAACEEFPDRIARCQPYECEYLHPFTGEPMKKRIMGWQGGRCHYVEQMPNGGKMECKYPRGLLRKIAGYFRAASKAKSTGFTIQGDFSGNVGVSQRIDGKKVTDPVQESLDNGDCVVTGY